VSAGIGSFIYVGAYKTETITAQHYISADNVVILGDNGRIKEQGPWHMIQANKTAVTKFRISTASNSVDIPPVVTKNLGQLGIKLRAVDEAGADIPRQTGDSALYCR
jgi:hypothetical protein